MSDGNTSTGFGENWKPMSADFDSIGGVYRRNSTYVKDGSLFQVLAFFNRGEFNYNESIHCSIGAKIRIGSSYKGQKWYWNENYAVKKNEDDSKGLSVSCSGKYFLNVELFRNQEPIDIYADKEPNHSFGDIQYKWEDNIKSRTWVVYVARFTICRRGGLHRDFGKPNKEDVAEALGLGESRKVESWNPWRMWTPESRLEDVELNIIARNIEQVLSVAAVPVPRPDCKGQYHLINSLIGGRFMWREALPKDYEARL
jgi:hypothetical protein